MAAVTLIGLDIGSTSIRAVETSRGKDGPVITNAGHASLPPGAVQSGVVHDDNAVTAALTELWASAKFRSRQVVLGVTNSQVVVREMSLANMPARELRQSLPFQVRDALPLPVERSLLDFYPLEDAGQNETVRGLLIAAPKEAVLTAVQAVERAGLTVVRVDLAAFALMRAAARLDSQVEAIVNIGANATSVIVHVDGEPLIVRTVPRGGAEITTAIAKRLNITADEAEALKRRIGLTPDTEPATADVIADAVRPLISEIRSSFAYLTAGDRPTRVARLALSGGAARLPGLEAALHTELGVNVVAADPTVRLKHTSGGHAGLKDFRHSAGVSIGLALGAA
jgi:type IV pilus assembly protein PilM